MLAIVFAVAFLESGSDDGRAVLDPVASYAVPSATRVPERGLWVVRLVPGDFLALADLDAANRAGSARRCRVYPVDATDPGLPELLSRYRSRVSAEAAGMPFLFREDCNGALYDAAGVRLDRDGPNLDRIATDIDSRGRIVAHTARRTCTARDGAVATAGRPCR